VLQNTFGNASRQWFVPSTKSITTTYSVLKADGESTLYISTGGGSFVATLPTLTAADAGWKVRFVKTSSDVNPLFIAPPSGTLNSGGVAGLARARRCIPGVPFDAIWDGAAWFVTRVTALPIGTCLEYHGSALPAGFEWPNGQTLSSSANYPEYNSVRGGLTTMDRRGYAGITLDNLGGSSAGRLPSGFITGTAVGNVGGVDGVTLSLAQTPAHQHNVYMHDPGHSHTVSINAGASSGGGGTTTFIPVAPTTPTTSTNTTGITIGSVPGTANDNLTTSVGSGGIHSNLQPSIMVSSILVVE